MQKLITSPVVWRHIDELKENLNKYRTTNKTIGFVPTMGALHSGHMSLVERAKKSCDKVVVSIFVNPTQFAEGEDYETYPRNFEKDYELLKQYGVDMLFMPDIHDIYSDNAATNVHVSRLGDVLCGKHRQGHFDGVATIVTILLNIIRPDISFFGEKDWQQLAIIRLIHRDLHLSGSIESVEIKRASDGLALSSRNEYLSKEERNIAPELYKTISELSYNITVKSKNIDKAIKEAKTKLELAGFDSIDYLEIRHGKSLELIKTRNFTDFRIFVAAYIGKTRLIDNIAVIA